MWSSPQPEQLNGIIQEYVVNITTENLNEELQTLSQGNSTIIGPLRPYYSYTVSVAARNFYIVDVGPYSPTVALTMPSDGIFILFLLLWYTIYLLLHVFMLFLSLQRNSKLPGEICALLVILNHLPSFSSVWCHQQCDGSGRVC